MSLSRSSAGRPAAPVRILHLGLGNFFRAHQAWYTEHAADAGEWGIAAFTGRSGDLAARLAAQDGLYTLLVREPDGDRPEVVSSVVAAHPGDDGDAWLGYWRSPELAVVTITVTEAGYCRCGDGIDRSDEAVAADVEALREGRLADARTAPGRLVAGMAARARAGLGPVTVLSCDNLPDNGAVARAVTTALAEAAGLGHVVEGHSFATSMVDRITPRTTDDDVAAVHDLTGEDDAAPVVTEPFVEWVVAGDFVAGRPAWDATFVADVRPFEQRKLWLLNGSHSLMAYAGSTRGHEVVSEAVVDPVVRAWVEEFWDEAARHLSVPAEDVAAYREALLQRFENTRIRHLLAQIAADGSQKVPVRAIPTLRAERAAGRDGQGAARVVAAWVRHLRGAGAPVTDPRKDELVAAAQGDLATAVPAVLTAIDPGLGADQGVVDLVVRLVGELEQA